MAKRGAAWRRSGLEAVADYAEDYITLFDLDFRHLFINRAGARSVGMAPPDLIGKTQAELGVPAELCALWNGHFEGVVRSGEARTFEYTARIVAGVRSLETLLAPVKDQNGRVEAITAITRDITSWKIDQALRNAQNEAMRTLAGGAGLAEMLQLLVRLAESNLRGRSCCILLAEPGLRQLRIGHAGKVPLPLLEAICREAIGPDNGACGASAFHRSLVLSPDLQTDPAWLRHRERVQAEGLRVCASQPILTADGELLGTFAFYGATARAPGGTELMVLREAALIAAIAIRHCRAQESLLVAEERFRALTENAANIVCVTDIRGLIQYISPAVEPILGFRPEELLGRSVYERVHPDDVEPSRTIYRSLRDKVGSQTQARYRFQHKDGGWRVLETIAKSQLDHHGRFSSVVSTRDVTEREALQEQLRFQALHDPLTGLINRRGFEERLHQLLEQARQDGAEHALCYIDLDQFKLINDSCGHAAGDELLRQLPQALLPLIGPQDTLARLGGDEFGVLLHGRGLEEAARLAGALRDAVKGFRFAWQLRNFSVGASIGVVSLTAKSPGIISALGAADVACYIAKEQGPNHVHVSYPHDLAVSRRRGEMRWVARLRQALEEDRFRLHFQTIAPLDGGAPACHELLLRLLDDDGKLVMPGAFIPAAERYQLMPALDTWVIHHLLRFLGQALPGLDALRHHRFGINLSGESLRDPNMPGSIRQATARHGVPPQMLYFEITETVAISNMAAAAEFIGGLKCHGCRFALDDFGSGMSSFAYLKHLPVDYLKIDGGFIRDIRSNPVDEAIVRAINSVAQRMGIATVAECVEDEPTLELLRAIGINHAQGYGVHRPQPLEELPALLGSAAGTSPPVEEPALLSPLPLAGEG
jgi:diguanylate cyclase (GGDEF)-like protein/PAS domain S-box-containing protein